jgi:hypothetical protein
MVKTASVEKRGFGTVPKVLAAAGLAVSLALPAKAIASNTPLFDSTPAAASAWAANPLFSGYGAEGLSRGEKRARENMIWLFSNTTDSAQTNKIIKSYFEAKGVSNRSLSLLGNIIGEIRSEKGEYHLTAPSELALYILFEKGDKARLRYVPQSPLLVMMGMDDVYSQYCAGGPGPEAPATATSTDSKPYSWEGATAQASKPETKTAAPETTVLFLQPGKDGTVYPGPYALKVVCPPKPKPDTAKPAPAPKPQEPVAQKPVPQVSQVPFTANEEMVRDLCAVHERQMRTAYNEQGRLIRSNDSLKRKAGSLQHKVDSLKKLTKHKHKKPVGSIAAVKPVEQKETPEPSFWAKAKHVFMYGMDQLFKGDSTLAQRQWGHSTSPSSTFSGKARPAAGVFASLFAGAGLIWLAFALNRKLSPKQRKKKALIAARAIIARNSASRNLPDLDFRSITRRALEIARKRRDTLAAHMFLNQVRSALEKGYPLETSPEMIDFSIKASSIGIEQRVPPKRRTAAPKKSRTKKRTRRLVSQLPGL